MNELNDGFLPTFNYTLVRCTVQPLFDHRQLLTILLINFSALSFGTTLSSAFICFHLLLGPEHTDTTAESKQPSTKVCTDLKIPD